MKYRRSILTALLIFITLPVAAQLPRPLGNHPVLQELLIELHVDDATWEEIEPQIWRATTPDGRVLTVGVGVAALDYQERGIEEVGERLRVEVEEVEAVESDAMAVARSLEKAERHLAQIETVRTQATTSEHQGCAKLCRVKAETRMRARAYRAGASKAHAGAHITLRQQGPAHLELELRTWSWVEARAGGRTVVDFDTDSGILAASSRRVSAARDHQRPGCSATAGVGWAVTGLTFATGFVEVIDDRCVDDGDRGER